MDRKTSMIILAILMAGSAGCSDEKAQHREAERRETERREAEYARQDQLERERQSNILTCEVEVEKRRNDYLHSAGKAVPGETGYLVSKHTQEMLVKIELEGTANCIAKYPKR